MIVAEETGRVEGVADTTERKSDLDTELVGERTGEETHDGKNSVCRS